MIFGPLTIKFFDIIEEASKRWSIRLGSWMSEWFFKGINAFLENNEPEAIDLVRQQLESIRDDPDVPEPFRNLINKLTAGTQPIPVLILIPLAILLLVPTITQISQPLGRILNYKQEHFFKTFRIDPINFINLLRRFPGKWDQYVEDLQDQGISDERLEALKDATLFYPTAQDLVTWLAREVFEPDAVAKYGLDDEVDRIDFSLFTGAGISEDQARNYWRAHWEHTSLMQMMELLHRGLLTKAGGVPAEPATAEEWEERDREGVEEMYEWYRLVEITPHWRDLITESLWNVPTRVDVRRWWDMRVIDEQELRSIYHRQGYHGKDLENYVMWTKVYVAFPDLLSRWSNGWITEEEVRDELARLGMPADRVEEFLQQKIKANQAARVEDTKTLTKTEIYKGVKQNKITRDEAVELLMDLNYARAEAEYLLDINIPVDETDVVVEERKLSKTDIRAALAEGLITREEASNRLTELRYSPANVELLLKLFEAANNPPLEDKARQASKADIVEGVKKGVITAEEGYTMLTDIGFSPDASTFILTVRAEESPFSPIDFTEFKSITQKWRQAVGQQSTPVIERLKAAAADLVRIKGEVKSLQKLLVEEEGKLMEDENLPPAVTERRDQVRVELNRALAEQERIQGHYDAMVAEFRQQEKG